MFMKPSLQLFDSVDFESVCVSFHEKFKPKKVESTSNEKTPKDLVAPTSGFKPINYLDTLETCLLDITNVKGRTCSHLKELQTDQLNLRRLHNFERPL